jgi:DHA1 family bicyclomycin/chloramphenicol resistance-like MFS transporter
LNEKASPLALTVLLGVLVALTPLGTDAWLPAVPSLADSIGASVASAQLTVTLFFAGIALGQLAWGPVSDRFGRKPVLLGGLALACGATAAGLGATSAEQVAATRLAQGLGMSCGPVIARSVVRDLYSHETAAQMLSRMTMVFSIMPIAAPLAGGLLLLVGGWQAVLALFSVVSLVLVLAVATGLRETAPAERASINPWRIALVLRDIGTDRRFLAPFALMTCGQIGIFAFVAGSALVLVKGMGVSAGAYSVLFALGMLGQITGAWLNTRLVLRLGMARMTRVGVALVLAGGGAGAVLAWAGVAHPLAVILPFMIFICGTSFTAPNATAAALTPFPRAAGAASSLLGACAFALGAVVSVGLGVLFDGTSRAMMTLMALGGAGAFLLERTVMRGKA